MELRPNSLNLDNNTCAARVMRAGGETGSRGHLRMQFGGRHGRRNHHPRGWEAILGVVSHCPGLQSSPELLRNNVGLGLKLTSEITSILRQVIDEFFVPGVYVAYVG